MAAVTTTSQCESDLVARTRLPEICARARATLLGAAIGDALGATLEFLTPSEIRARYGRLTKIVGGGWLNLRPGAITDDTEMSLCLARSLATGAWSPEDAARRFVEWLRGCPTDVGNTCRRGIARYINTGRLWAPPNEGDAGNGAAMRVAPVALATLGDQVMLGRMAVEQAHLTHNHPLSDAACVLIGGLIHLGCLGEPQARLRRLADETATYVPRFHFSPYRGLATGYVVDTVQTVLHFFFSTASFEDCLVATVNQGGDADTTGTIAGAIAGAYYGPRGIPRRWIRKVSKMLVLELGSLADKLVARSPLGQHAVRLT
jgi:ADP-ribosyl-[dinitrogen reductase] hydrolase